MSAAPPPVADGAGASLLDEGAPEKKRRLRTPKDPNALPSVKPPTDVQVAKAVATVDAARLDADRQKAAALIRQAFDEEDVEVELSCANTEDGEAKVARVGIAEAFQGNRDTALRAALRPLVLGVAALEDPVTLAAVGVQVAAACGNALEEARAWDQQAEREARLYEARAGRAKKRAARVRTLLEGLVMEYCAVAPKDPGLSRWSFPTTTIVVAEKTSKTGRLEVVDDDRAAAALRKAVGPMDAAGAIKVEQKVYLKEAQELLVSAKVDLSRVDGFKYTPPGVVSRRVEER